MPNAITLSGTLLLGCALGCGSSSEHGARTPAAPVAPMADSAKAPATKAASELASTPGAANAKAAASGMRTAGDGKAACSTASCAAPSYCVADRCIEPGTVVAHGRRGANYGDIPPEQFRYQDMNESDAIAPGGLFATEGDGRLFVLDQLDDQIHVYRGGQFETAIATPTGTAVDHFVVLPNGEIVLLDGYGSRNVLVLIDQKGRVLRELPLTGKGFAEHEGALGLRLRPDGVWALRDEDMVRVLDASGNPDPERLVVAGLLSGDGRTTFSVRANGSALEVSARARDGHGAARNNTLELGGDASVLQTESDAGGKLYVLLKLRPSAGSRAEGRAAESTCLLELGPDLQLLRKLELPTRRILHTVATPLFVSPVGFAYYLDARMNGVQVLRY